MPQQSWHVGIVVDDHADGTRCAVDETRGDVEIPDESNLAALGDAQNVRCKLVLVELNRLQRSNHQIVVTRVW